MLDAPESATGVLLHLAAGVAVLLFGISQVQRGMLRAFGATLRRVLGAGLGNRLAAFGAGAAVTTLLQSSTATVLLASSFAARGMLATTASLAVLLGADVGTTLVAQVLARGVTAVAPLLLIAGVAIRSTDDTRTRNIGRVLIGLGLILLGLQLILRASEPLRGAELVPQLFGALTDEPLLALGLAALLTVAAHSSLAVVLLIVSLASNDAVSPPLALVLVLGANVGGALVPVIANWSGPAEARRAPLGNVLFKLIGAAVVLPLAGTIEPWIAAIDGRLSSVVINFHTAFNIAVALVFLPLTGVAGRLIERLVPTAAEPDDPGAPRHLDDSVAGVPGVALAKASRETLRLAELVQSMVGDALAAFRTDDPARIDALRHRDDAVDRLVEAIKLYLVRISREELDEEDGRRAAEILTFAVNLEHIGDLVASSLMDLAAKRQEKQIDFSEQGLDEIAALHGRLMEHLELAVNLLVSRDLDVARRLVSGRADFRTAEQEAVDSHMARLNAGNPASIASSAVHFDVLRDLKQIDGHIADVAKSILEEAGELRETRLRKKRRNSAA